MKDIRKLFDAYPILEVINNENNDVIKNNAIYKILEADELMNTCKEQCIYLLFVISGNISIQKLNKEGGETHLYNIEKGEVCHEALSCFMKFEPLNIVGRAMQESELYVLPFEIVNEYLLKNIDFIQYIYKDLHSKFNGIITKKEEIKYDSIENRLVKLLLEKNSSIIYSTHNQLAFELDTAREVVSRKLKKLESEGYIKRQRGKLQLLDKIKEIIEE